MDVADEASTAALVLELDHGDTIARGRQEPHVGEGDVLYAAGDLASNRDPVRGNAGLCAMVSRAMMPHSCASKAVLYGQ